MMIKNEREHHITKTQLEKFDEALADTTQAGQSNNVPPPLQTAQVDALQSQRDSLHQELAEYETVKAGTEQVHSEQTAFERLQHLVPGMEHITLTDEDLASVLLDDPDFSVS